MYHGFVGHGWSMGLWWIIGLVVLVALVLIVIWATNQNRRKDLPGDKNPMDVLKERYARGEIDREEFEQKKRDLSS